MAWHSVNSHKVSPLGLIFGLSVVVPSQCCTISAMTKVIVTTGN